MAHAFSKPIEADDDHEEETYICELCRGEVDGSDYVGCCRDGDCPRRIDKMCSDCAEWTDKDSFWMCPHCAGIYHEMETADEAIEKLEEALETFGDLRKGRGDIYDELISQIHHTISQLKHDLAARWDA